jgi:hypothetical protein
MTDHEIPPPATAVRRRIETRRVTAIARLAEPPSVAQTADASVCDGWGLVPVMGLDGEYEPAACLGCALCSEVRPPAPGRAMARMPVIPTDDELEM